MWIRLCIDFDHKRFDSVIDIIRLAPFHYILSSRKGLNGVNVDITAHLSQSAMGI